MDVVSFVHGTRAHFEAGVWKWTGMDVWPCTLEMKTAGEEASSGHRNDDGPSHSWPAWPECAVVWPNRFPNLTKLQLSYPKRGGPGGGN